MTRNDVVDEEMVCGDVRMKMLSCVYVGHTIVWSGNRKLTRGLTLTLALSLL